jgi:peptidoglycan/LPS O-acetylase OafA/YrhL
MTFRNDIQILRAIAVIFVVLYHLEVPGFANGLLGVDIFFAISGYLMFRIYNFDQGAGGFYARRGRRLLPAYFATVLCTLAACYLMVQPSDFRQTAEQSLYAGLFASNIGFWSQNSYFNTVDFKPLLHLWSLAVELQFYLFVPLIMLLDRWNKYVLPVLVAGSLALCLFLLLISPNASFFMMPTRLWQFGLGMLAARASMNSTGNPWIGLAAVTGLLAMLFFPTIGYGAGLIQGHPGLGAILATVATALCLYHGLAEAWLSNAAGRAMRYIGDISYSIYLVHFPVIVLVNYRPFGGTILGASSLAGYALIFALIGALAWGCHQIFEKRAGRWVSVPSTLAASAALVIAGLWLPATQARQFDDTTNRISAAFTDRAPYRCGTLFRIQHFSDDFCVFGPREAARGHIMLIGDSHSDAIKSSFVAEARRAGHSVLFPVNNDAFVSTAMDENWLLAAAIKYRVRHVFLHFSLANTKPAMMERAQTLLWQHGIATTVIMPVPTREALIPQILLGAHERGVPAPLQSTARYEQSIRQVAAELRRPRPGYAVIEPSLALCTHHCQIQGSDGAPYYFDKHHLTLTGARQLAPLLRAAMAKPLSSHPKVTPRQ